MLSVLYILMPRALSMHLMGETGWQQLALGAQSAADQRLDSPLIALEA